MVTVIPETRVMRTLTKTVYLLKKLHIATIKVTGVYREMLSYIYMGQTVYTYFILKSAP